MIRIVLADDQTLLRDALACILNKSSKIEVVESVSNGKEAISSCQKYKPDVILMDIQMPIIDGVEATKIIKEKFPNIKILMLTTFENVENIIESFSCGADGYIVKDLETKDLILCIECVYRGIHVSHDSVHKLMVKEFAKMNNKKFESKGIGSEVELTEREIEVIRLVALGKTNKEIAQIIGFAEGTVKNRITRLFEKLNLSDRIQIAVFAIENNII